MNIEANAILKGLGAGAAAGLIFAAIFATRFLIHMASNKSVERLNYAFHGALAGAVLYLSLFVDTPIEGWFLLAKNLLGFTFSYAYMIYWTSRRLNAYEGSSSKAWLFTFPPLGIMYFIFLCFANNKSIAKVPEKSKNTPPQPKISSSQKNTSQSDRIDPTF